MKRILLFLSLFLILIITPSAAQAADTLFYTIEETKSPIKEKTVREEKNEDKTVDLHFKTSGKKYLGLGNRIVIGHDDILYEDLSLINSELVINGTLNGSINFIFGDLVIDGVVNGDINVFGGRLLIKKSAIINGNISFVGKEFQLEQGATVHGKVVSKRSPAVQVLEPIVTLMFSGIPEHKILFTFLWYLVRLGIVLLILHIFRKGVMRINEAISTSPFTMFILGLLVIAAVSAVVFGTVITILLLPVGITILIIAFIFFLFSIAVISGMIGEKIFHLLKIKHTGWVLRGVIGYIIFTILNSIPAVGWVITLVLTSFVIGALILTSFGRKNYFTHV